MQYRERKIRKNRELAHPAQDSPVIEKKANIKTQSWPYLAGQEGSTQAESKQTTQLAEEQAFPGTENPLYELAKKLTRKEK